MSGTKISRIKTSGNLRTLGKRDPKTKRKKGQSRIKIFNRAEQILVGTFGHSVASTQFLFCSDLFTIKMGEGPSLNVQRSPQIFISLIFVYPIFCSTHFCSAFLLNSFLFCWTTQFLFHSGLFVLKLGGSQIHKVQRSQTIFIPLIFVLLDHLIFCSTHFCSAGPPNFCSTLTLLHLNWRPPPFQSPKVPINFYSADFYSAGSHNFCSTHFCSALTFLHLNLRGPHHP